MGKKPAPQQPLIQQAPITPAAPPPTKTAQESAMSAMDLRQQEMLKKNIRSTVKAGDTGGFKMPATVKPAGGNPLVPPQGKF